MEVKGMKTVGLILSLVIAFCMVVPTIGIIAGGAQPSENVRVMISYDLETKSDTISRAIQSCGGEIQRIQDKGVGRFWVDIPLSKMDRIAEISGVETVEIDNGPIEFLNLISTSTYMGHDVAQAGGFTGSGILGEVQDGGCQVSHPDFDVDFTDGVVAAADHGTCTYGIVFSQGTNDMTAEGMLPDALSAFSDYADNSKYNSVSNCWNGQFTSGNAGQNGLFQSNSWGYSPMDGTYGTHTQEADQASYDFPRTTVLWAAGNSNSGVFKGSLSQESTCKNALTVGAIWHENTANMADDSWYSGGTGNSPSQGPAADGRQKPDVIGPFDDTYCTDQTGSAGYASGDYYATFGGTSGATPVVAGIVGQAYEMYIENHFGNNPGGAIPYSTTIKSLMITDAFQYDLADSDRDSQGWGSADAEQIYTLGADYHVFEEGISVAEGASWSRQVTSDGSMPLKISVSWLDPPAGATTGSARALRNNLDLKVTAPGGAVYWGNNGLYTNLYSSSGTGTNDWTRNIDGGYLDDENNVENVFIQSPTSGSYTVDVFGRSGDMQSSPQMFSMVASGAQDVGSLGTIALDQAVYLLEDTAGIEVTDTDLNTNSGSAQTVNINVASNAEPAGETVTLTETGPDTSVFTGTVTLSATNGAGIVLVANGNTLTARYNDADDGSGSPAVVTDTALIDGAPPGPVTGLTVDWFGVGAADLLNDDVEGGNLGYTTGGDLENFAIRTLGSHGGTSSWDFGNGNYQESAGENSYLISPALTIPAGSISASLSFWHWWDFEATNWDGANLKISTTGAGGTFNLVTPTGGQAYTGAVASGYNNPLAGQQAWTNAQASFVESTFDLSGYIGQTVHIKWDVGVDSYATTDAGWRIDDIVVAIVGSGANADNLLNWTLSSDDGAGANDVSHYNIYRANNGAGPWTAGAIIDTVSAGIDTYTDPTRGEFDGINWYYVVRAEDINGNIEMNTNAVPEQASGNQAPNAPFNPTPADTATGIGLNPTLSVDVTDPNGDVMDVYFYNAAGSTLIGTDNNVASGGTASINWNGRAESTTYNWYAIADDDSLTTQSATWSFTTLDTTAPASPTGLTVEHYGSAGGPTPVVEGFQLSGATTASTNLVLNAPAGITSGELLLLIVMNEDNTATPQFSNNLAGWNFIGTAGTATSDAHIGSFWRVADGTEGASVTVVAQSADGWMGWYIRISGADTTMPLEASNFASSGNSAARVIPQITTTQDNCLAVYGLAFDGGDGDPFSVAGTGWSESAEGQSGGAANTDVSGCWGTKDQTTAGGTGTATVNSAVSDGSAYFMMTIKPAPGGGGLDDNAVNWTRSADDGIGDNDVDYYNIYRSDVITGPWDAGHIIDTVPATGAASYSYIDLLRGQADATLWWYVVRAVDLSANEDSNTVSVQEPGFVVETAYNIDLFGFSAGDWVFISYPIDISGNIQDILNDVPEGDGQTTWDVAKWYNPLTPADPWKTYRFGGSFNDPLTIDNTRGVWLRLTSNGGDQQLTTGLTGDYSAGNVIVPLNIGWNLVSYPSATSRLASNTLPGGITDMVAFYDGGSPYLITEALPTEVMFTEGNAYWVHATAAGTWTVVP